MSKFSKSKSDEFDPITYHHWLEFEIRRLKRSSDDFQQLFEDIMVRARTGFIRVRPYGNIGDRKCDGLFRDDCVFFQVYSPDELEQAKVQKKIDEDLDGAVAHWGDALKTWVFVYNVRRGIPPDIPTTLQEKQQQYPDIKIDQLSNDDLWEITRGLSIEQRNEILGLPPSLTIERKHTSDSFTERQWQETCRRVLPELDANSLISGDGVTLGIEDIVPLDLVERKEHPKPTRDPSPENLQQALEGQEIPVPYNQFFEQVLARCKSRNQRGKGVAIIGEPGAGKTTLLCAIAQWVMKRGELPIYVPLQALETGLEPYLLETWLRKAFSKRKATEQLQDDLVKQCNADRVWLLLDGIDEMAQSERPLSILTKDLQGWISDARIVLSCRVNVWEANKNVLRSQFETYRSRGFRDEEQLIFIQNFFEKANQGATGVKLIEKLEYAPSRLKDLVKNPLWLTLLCRTWKRKPGELPATKAELYAGFVKTFYDWKDKPHISEEKRSLLERALGELAKKAIDQENFRFRLRETFIRQELDKFDFSLFRIVCELGWINKLGSALENPEEPVYAFLHPTFQEYFAALAIDDWDDFLPRSHVDKPIENHKGECRYRIFESQWKEVILLWLGRSTLREDEKEEFINRLITFDDGGGDFYKYRAYFLAAAGIAEFECSRADEIIKKLIGKGFRLSPRRERDGFEDICELAKEGAIRTRAISTLLETNREKASIALVKISEENQDSTFPNRNILDTLGKIGFNHPTTIEFLEKLIFDTRKNGYIRQEALESLARIDPNNANVAHFSEYLITRQQSEAIEELFRPLEQSYTGKPILICEEEKIIIEVSHSRLFHWLAYKGLKDIAVKEQLTVSVVDLRTDLFDAASRNDPKVFIACYEPLWQCTENMSYPVFYRAWHDPPSSDVELLTNDRGAKS